MSRYFHCIVICSFFAVISSCSNPFGSDIAINVIKPPVQGATADDAYIIEWTLDAPEYSDTGVLLFVDTDLDPSTGLIQISDTLSVETTGFLWDCSKFPQDSYYVRAMIFNGSRSEYDYSEGKVTVMHSGKDV